MTGTVFYARYENMTVVDALYFTLITLTTIGYGDIIPTTTGGKLFTVVYVILGLGVVGGLIGMLAHHTIAENAERKNRSNK